MQSVSKNSGPFNSSCGLLCATEGPGCILVDKFASSIRVRVVVFIATLGVQGLIFYFSIFNFSIPAIFSLSSALEIQPLC